MDISPRSFDLKFGRYRKRVKLSNRPASITPDIPDRIIISCDLRAEIVLQEIIVDAILCKANRFCDFQESLLPHALIHISTSLPTFCGIFGAPRGSKSPLNCNTDQSDHLHYSADCECKPDADSIYHRHDETGSSSSE